MMKVWLLIKSDLKILCRWSPWRCRWLLAKRRQTRFSWWDSLARWRLFLMKHELMFMCGWFLSEGGREKANIDSRRLSLKLERKFFHMSHENFSNHLRVTSSHGYKCNCLFRLKFSDSSTRWWMKLKLEHTSMTQNYD